MAKSQTKAARGNRANQLNPTHTAYHQARGASPAEATRLVGGTKVVRDNRSRQLNPNDTRYSSSKGSQKSKSSTSQ